MPRPVDVSAFFKVDGDIHQCILCQTAQNGLVRDAQQFGFNRLRDARLHFLRRHARRFQDQLDLCGRDIGEGVDRYLLVRAYAQPGQNERQHEHEPAPSQREFDQGIQHVIPPTIAL